MQVFAAFRSIRAQLSHKRGYIIMLWKKIYKAKQGKYKAFHRRWHNVLVQYGRPKILLSFFLFASSSTRRPCSAVLCYAVQYRARPMSTSMDARRLAFLRVPYDGIHARAYACVCTAQHRMSLCRDHCMLLCGRQAFLIWKYLWIYERACVWTLRIWGCDDINRVGWDVIDCLELVPLDILSHTTTAHIAQCA